MKTRLIVLENKKRPWFIGNALPERRKDGSIRYIGYSIENTLSFSFIGNHGTENYFYIK